MGYRILKLVLLISLFTTSNIFYGQERPSTREVEDNNDTYIVHTVEMKQTLYAISKMYSVTVDDIKKTNKEIEEFGIKIGQTIRIPISEINKKEAKKASITLSADTIYHEVLKKETLYALTKKYELSEAQLIKYNPVLIGGLKVGMTVKIPVELKSVKDESLIQFESPIEDSLELHEVQPKETLYFLSKKYNVSIDSIQMVNNGLTEGLRVGSSIRIPIPNKDFFELKDSTIVESLVDTVIPITKNDTLNIAVFLPFCNSKNLSLQEKNKDEKLFILTKVSIEFMRGLEMSIDSLVTLGYHISTQYFDTKNDTSVCRELIDEEDLNRFDLFVGPLFQVNFKLLASKAKELKIPIVSPVKISSSLLLDNRYVIKSYASLSSQFVLGAKYIGQKYADSNIVLFAGGDPDDKKYSDIYQKYLSNTVGDSVPVHRVWQANMDNFQKHLKIGDRNYVVLVSSNEAFVSTALSVFYRLSLSNKSTSFVVFGLESWKEFGSLDFDYLMGLNVTYPVRQYIDYLAPETSLFISKYREKYFKDPSAHVFSGFDIGWYLVNSLFNSNGDWENYIEMAKEEGFSIPFDFLKVGKDSGFENKGGFLLRNDNDRQYLVR